LLRFAPISDWAPYDFRAPKNSDATRKLRTDRPPREKASSARRRRRGRARRAKVGRARLVLPHHRSLSRLVARRSLHVLPNAPARAFLSETNTTSKNVSRAHCRVRGTFGRKLNPFSRELRRVIRVRREAPGASPRARQSEMPDDLESPLIPRLVMIATIIDFVMMGRGRRAGTSREGTHVVAASARR